VLSRKILFQVFVACGIIALLCDGRREKADEREKNDCCNWNSCHDHLPNLESPRFNARSAAGLRDIPPLDDSNSDAIAIVSLAR
jgi:hypothetical protein